jgi:hypothetical protein
MYLYSIRAQQLVVVMNNVVVRDNGEHGEYARW